MKWQGLVDIFAGSHTLPSIQLEFHHLTDLAVLEQLLVPEVQPLQDTLLIRLSIKQPAAIVVYRAVDNAM